MSQETSLHKTTFPANPESSPELNPGFITSRRAMGWSYGMELWGRAMGWSYGVERWGGAMGWSYGV